MNLSYSDVLRLTGGKPLRPAAPELSISGVATLAEARPGEVAFLGNEKYFHDYLSTKASLVLVPPGLTQHPEGVALIETENPSLAFNALVDHFMKAASDFVPGIAEGAWVAPTARLDASKVRVAPGAVIEDGAVIGDGCDIGPGCVIGKAAVLGENCKLYARVVVRERCILGNRVVIQPGAVIGARSAGSPCTQRTTAQGCSNRSDGAPERTGTGVGSGSRSARTGSQACSLRNSSGPRSVRGNRTAKSSPRRHCWLSQPPSTSRSSRPARSGCCSARSARTSSVP